MTEEKGLGMTEKGAASEGLKKKRLRHDRRGGEAISEISRYFVARKDRE